MSCAPAQFIGGEWVRASSTLTVEDPSTGGQIGQIGAGDAQAVDMAVRAATDAMAPRRWGPAQRQDALLALARAIEEQAAILTVLESRDAGKPIFATSHIDIPAAAAVLRYYAGWAARLTGETVELAGPGDGVGYVLREPVGVVGQIIPWNYPLMGVAFKIGPALATGCACVLKPSELTSLSALWLARSLERCGVPAGYVNIVTGTGAQAGAALVAHPDVAKISFTGSTAVGRQIAAQAAGACKRVTVELGGKSPVIVMPDADLDRAAMAIAMNIFSHCGQTCSAGSRLIAHESVADDLARRVAHIGASMRMGPVDDPDTRLGPVISAIQRGRIAGHVDAALAAGARALCGGVVPDGPGYYYPPTVLCDVTPDMSALREEIFGPVLTVQSFASTDLDAIAAMANDTPYGLAAYVWTGNLAWAQGMARRIRAGSVRINAGGGGDMALPSGGMKMSGFGRENGRAGIEAYTELKSVAMLA
ncbi:aldehyde dehydrogenase family protein [Novosphingobium sp. FSY-8]|uniref:Aldehyde dehydrogenase family protein n=2 Tax=Novosphingobium ovatum TaxID=1908523 RepID=A0ABW9XG22_9SPHN|nr:aldehyde dehydrogenase family protein [Novosphingobium ovatum]